MIQLAASPIIGALYSKGSEGQKDAFLSIFIVIDKMMIDVATWERDRDTGLFITLVLKVYYIVFLFVGLPSLRTFLEFLLVVSSS